MRTKVSKNTTKSHSLKSTIPEGIAEALKLVQGDSVDWSVEVRDGRIVALVEKAEKAV